MFNGKISEGRSEILAQGPAREPRHYWFVDGIVNSLLPRLEEIKHTEELVLSDCTMDLIEFLFNKYEMDPNELTTKYLVAIVEAMPFVLEDLKRLSYPLLKPAMFECAKAFAEKMEKAAEERKLTVREKVEQALEG
jgi:hypothetical protein